jgi:phosphatidylglycerol:prolipoprotein diacylglycerol transferase
MRDTDRPAADWRRVARRAMLAALQFPIDIHLGVVTMPAHLVLELLAYTLGFRYYLALRRRGDPISDHARAWIFIAAATGGLLGSRLLGLLEHPALWTAMRSPALLLTSKTVVGGLLGGLIAVEWAKRRLGVRSSSGDLMVYPLLLGLMIGRVGCFMAGLEDGTHGAASSLPWAIDLGDGVPRHPLPLYEIGFLSLLWAGLRRLQARVRLADGALFRLWMVVYLGFRLGLELLKPEPRPWFGLSAIQLACVAGLFYYRRVLLRPHELVISEDRPCPSATTSITTSP